MIRQITESLQFLISPIISYIHPLGACTPLLEKIKRVAECLLIACFMTFIFSVSPNLCYLSFFVGVFCGDEVKLLERTKKIVGLWKNFTLPAQMLAITTGYFVMPLLAVTATFLSYGSFGDYIQRTFGQKGKFLYFRG